MAAPESGGVFISYRRQDARGSAGRIYDRLAARLGDDQVFMDVDRIGLGIDFAEVITQAVSTCQVLVAVIGPRWLTATDEEGRRRLDDPDDLVRLEVEAALERDIRVIPILVEGAAMPRRQELPESLAKLARRNAHTVRHESFRHDADQLANVVEGVLRAGAPPASPGQAASAHAAPRPGGVEVRSRAAAPGRLDMDRFLRSLDNDAYRQALRGFFDAASLVGLVFEWGSVGTSIRLPTTDRQEPLTVAWVFPGHAGWSGLRHLTLGYNTSSAARTPSVREALSDYVTAVSRVAGATRAKPRALDAYTFAPEAVVAKQEQLVRLLQGLARRARDHQRERPHLAPDHAADGAVALASTPATRGPTPADVLAAPTELRELRHSYDVHAVAFSPDGKLLATGSSDRTAQVWEAATGQKRAQIIHETQVNAVAFSPDGKLLATASNLGTARVWDVATGHERVRITDETQVIGVAFSPNGQLLATASRNRRARVWEVATGQERLRVTHNSWVYGVAFSRDGRLLATASRDQTARVWEVATGQERLRVTHSGSVYAVAFSPNGRLLATASDDNTARVWEVASGQERARVTHNEPVWGVAFSRDGRLLATASDDNTARVWTLFA